MLGEGEREEGNVGIDRLLTDRIFLDSIPDPDPFENLDLIKHSDPLAFSGLPIRSNLPIHLAFNGPPIFFLFVGKLV
jgi:hypothetical protein